METLPLAGTIRLGSGISAPWNIFACSPRGTGNISTVLGLSIEDLTKVCHYDLSVREKVVLWVHDFVYWQFRRGTFLARTLLPLLPKIRHAKTWTSAPIYTCTRDHVVAIFRARGDQR